jgi:hypothetical protein
MLLFDTANVSALSPAPAPVPQVKYILGLKLPRAETMQHSLELIFDNISGFK